MFFLEKKKKEKILNPIKIIALSKIDTKLNLSELLKIKKSILFIIKYSNSLENICYDLERYCNSIKIFIDKYPYIFNKKFIALLFLYSEGEIFDKIKDLKFSEELLIEILKEERRYNNFLIGETYPLFNFKRNLVDKFPIDFYIKKSKNVRKIRKKYIKEALPFIKDFSVQELDAFLDSYYIDIRTLYKLNLNEKDKSFHLGFAKHLINKFNISLNLTDFLNYSKYTNEGFIEDIIKLNELSYLDIDIYNLLKDHKIEVPQILDLSEECPNLSLKINLAYINTEDFKTLIKKVLNTYTKIENNKRVWTINALKREKLIDDLTDNFITNNYLHINFSEELYKDLIFIDKTLFIYIKYSEKYSKENLQYLQSLENNQYIKQEITNIEKLLVRIKTEINDCDSILENSLYKELCNNEITINEIKKYKLNKAILNFNKIIEKYLRMERDSNIIMEYLNSFPQLLKCHDILMILSQNDLEKITLKYPQIFKTVNSLNENLNSNFYINIIINHPKNIKFLKKDFLEKEELIVTRIINNEKIFISILKSMKFHKISFSDNLKKIIGEKYTENENENFLFFMDEEYIESLIIINEINIRNIKNNTIKKKIKKIYTTLELKDFL